MAEKVDRTKASKKAGRGFFLRYLAVLLAGLLAVGAAYVFIPDKRNEDMPQPPETVTDTQTEHTEQTAPETTEALPSSMEPVETEQTQEQIPLPSFDPYQGTVVDSYYQYANNYTWQDLSTLMILIGQSGVGINEGSEGKNAAFSLISVYPGSDPLIFIGFNDPVTNRSNMTLYASDGGYVYELLQIREEEIWIDPRDGAIIVGDGTRCYHYTPHVLIQTSFGSEEIPAGFEKLPITDATGLNVTVQNVGSYVLSYPRKGGRP